MNPFEDLVQMTRDYGLSRYFAMTLAVVVALMLVLFLWGRVPDPPTPAEVPAEVPAAPSSQ